MPDTEQLLLAMTNEAAVLVQGGRAIYANAAAREILGEDCVGKRVTALFGDLVAGVQASSFLAQIRLRERPCLLRISRLGQDQVFFLRPQEELPAVLNQPFLYALRSSLMNMELAAEHLRGEAEKLQNELLLEKLSVVTRSQFQILRMINNASLVLSLAEGDAVCAPQVFDLSALCEELAAGAGALVPQLRFPCNCGKRVLLRADPRLVKDLLINLLSNAVRHGKGCSRVSLSLLEGEKSVVLAVDDDGCGIPPEELPRVLDRYRHGFRLDQMNAGPGLGLTAVRLAAQAHGGALLLESRADQGTTVRVSLQRGEQELLRAPEEAPTLETRELLTGLADCLPADCFREQYLD
jgi:signal transduction histidine kinase